MKANNQLLSDKIKSRPRKMRNKLFLFTFILSLCLGFGFFLFLRAAAFLVVDQPPVKSDAIIILSGGKGRLEKGVSLQKEGYGEYLILSNSNYLSKKTALKKGIPNETIIEEGKADSTYTNATLTKEIMLEKGFQSAIVVSSSYHMRRSKYIFDKIYDGTDISLTYVAYHDPSFQTREWFSDQISKMYVMREYKKLIGYILLY